jgi:hypothetical protein
VRFELPTMRVHVEQARALTHESQR